MRTATPPFIFDLACCFLMACGVALKEIANVDGTGASLSEQYEVYKALITSKTLAKPA